MPEAWGRCRHSWLTASRRPWWRRDTQPVQALVEQAARLRGTGGTSGSRVKGSLPGRHGPVVRPSETDGACFAGADVRRSEEEQDGTGRRWTGRRRNCDLLPKRSQSFRPEDGLDGASDRLDGR